MGASYGDRRLCGLLSWGNMTVVKIDLEKFVDSSARLKKLYEDKLTARRVKSAKLIATLKDMKDNIERDMDNGVDFEMTQSCCVSTLEEIIAEYKEDK